MRRPCDSIGSQFVLEERPCRSCMIMAQGTTVGSSADLAPSEAISHQGKTLCILIRGRAMPEKTTFYTPDAFNLQVGKIVYPAGSEIPRHTHVPVTRTVQGTSEVLIVQKGR